MQVFFFVVFGVSVGLLCGCGEMRDSDQITKSQLSRTTEVTGLFRVLSDERTPSVKRSVEVLLHDKVPVETLRLIATRIHDSDPSRYERTFITHYLPDSDTDSVAWATTHFTPDLRVQILGTTKQHDKKLTDLARASHKHEIGQWKDATPLVGGILTLYTEDTQVFLEILYPDGSRSNKAVTESSSKLGRVFHQSNGSEDYWVLDRAGNLQIRDSQGLITTAKAIK